MSSAIPVIMDHQTQKYAFKKKEVHGRLSGWLEALPYYDFEIHYKLGALESTADVLSRYVGDE